MSIASPTKVSEIPDDIYYPSGDDEPMAETQLHIRAIILLMQALEDLLAARLDIYIAADMFWYWEKGNVAARRAPDVMVIKGVGRAIRRSFMSWKENGAIPNAIFEMASESTWRENLNEKRRLYEQLGVREYFLFDPEYKYLRPALVGFRLNDAGEYIPLLLDGEGRLRCEELGCILQVEGALLRVIDAQTGEPVLQRGERIELEKRRTLEARQRADVLEREVAQLKALLGRNGGADSDTM